MFNDQSNSPEPWARHGASSTLTRAVLRMDTYVLLGMTLLVSFIPACSKSSTNESSSDSLGTPVAQEEELLVFPEELYVTDISVNLFVIEAMKACASGNYDAFRVLWSVKQDPLTREEFSQGWQAAEKIRVRALERVMFADQTPTEMPEVTKGELVFVMLADVQLDPSHPAGQRKPKREAVLMILKEQDQWRLARAPKTMREWIKKRVDAKKSSTTHD